MMRPFRASIVLTAGASLLLAAIAAAVPVAAYPPFQEQEGDPWTLAPELVEFFPRYQGIEFDPPVKDGDLLDFRCKCRVSGGTLVGWHVAVHGNTTGAVDETAVAIAQQTEMLEDDPFYSSTGIQATAGSLVGVMLSWRAEYGAPFAVPAGPDVRLLAYEIVIRPLFEGEPDPGIWGESVIIGVNTTVSAAGPAKGTPSIGPFALAVVVAASLCLWRRR